MSDNSILYGLTRPGRHDLQNPEPHASGGIANRARMAVQGPDGKIKHLTDWIENVANTFGLASLASMVGSGAAVTASTLVSMMKIGTGTTAATSTDASLVASTGSVVITAASLTKTNLGNRTVEYQATFASNNPAGAATITEVGLFCNSTADSQLLARLVLTGAQSVNKGASDQILVSYDTIYTTA
jgi:hypothetical protein